MRPIELYGIVHSYLDGKISLEEMEELYVPYLPQLMADPNWGGADLLGTIELGIAELQDGILNEAEFRQELAQAARWVVQREGETLRLVRFGKQFTEASSSAPTISRGFVQRRGGIVHLTLVSA